MSDTLRRIEALDRQIESRNRDLCGCRNKHVKDRLYREIADLRSRRGELVAQRVSPVGSPGILPGVCKFCGCTEDHACEGGCAWADDERTICTRCVERSLQLALSPEKQEAA